MTRYPQCDWTPECKYYQVIIPFGKPKEFCARFRKRFLDSECWFKVCKFYKPQTPRQIIEEKGEGR